MDRRAFVSGIALAAAAPLAAQERATSETGLMTGTTQNIGGAFIIGQEPEVPLEKRREQYAICQERGHRRTVDPNIGPLNAVPAIGTFYLPHAPVPYPNIGEGDWATCWHCKTRYRFVTKMEEDGAPA
jgi:hypothetical protein